MQNTLSLMNLKIGFFVKLVQQQACYLSLILKIDKIFGCLLTQRF